MARPDVLRPIIERLKLTDLQRNTKRSRAKMAQFAARKVRIWSGEWCLWWRPNGCGYTKDYDQAGVYVFSDAYGRTYHCGPEKKIEYFAEPCPPVEAR